jgi:glyoxylase-like metal-dependent hydrolase (beta-lactamase superfamily II)
MTVWICQTCAVEHERADGVCAICADERQWLPAAGQQWTTLAQLSESGHRTQLRELEPDLLGITVEPKVGIGQQAHLVTTPAGSVLWDPTGYVDDEGARQARERGDVIAITSSHPHMFGVQSQWSRALGGVPILVCEDNMDWVARPDPSIKPWSGRLELAPGVTLLQLGGHFRGSSVIHWEAGAGGKGVLLVSDTIHANPDRATVTFMRSYPNRIPLSPAIVQRIATAVDELAYDRLYDNFGKTIDTDAAAAVQRSAVRFIGWTRGEFDDRE